MIKFDDYSSLSISMSEIHSLPYIVSKYAAPFHLIFTGPIITATRPYRYRIELNFRLKSNNSRSERNVLNGVLLLVMTALITISYTI